MAKTTFEQSLKQLEQIVDELESGELPLEKAVKKFEEGIQLAKHCNRLLTETEKKITLLTRDSDDKIRESDFSTENAS
jgi:exodeoxyribonuclease VII small subunit